MVIPYPSSASKQQVRIAPETAYGVLPGSPSWKRLGGIMARPAMALETDPFVASGDSVPGSMTLNDDYTTFDVSGRASYTDVMYVLSSMFGFPITTLLSGSTYQHVWTWNGTDELWPQSYSLDYGDSRLARRVLGVIFNSLDMTTARTGIDFGSSAFGKDLNTTALLGGTVNEVQTLTPTTVTAGTFALTIQGRTVSGIQYNVSASALQTLLDNAFGPGNFVVAGGPMNTTPITITFVGRYVGKNVGLITVNNTGLTGTIAATETTPGADNATNVPTVPIFPLHADIFIDNSWAAVIAETTQMLALYQFGMAMGERYARTMPINSQRTSDNVVEAEDQEHTVTMQFGADATADSMIASLRAGTMKFARVKYEGGLTGDLTHQYSVFFDMALLLSGHEGFDTANGVHVANLTARLAKDTSGNCFTATVINKQAGL